MVWWRRGGHGVSELTERLSLVDVEAQSPDRGLTASVRGRGDVRVSFGFDAYRMYTAVRLTRQLEALATLLWARYRRRYLEVVAEWTGLDEDAEADEADLEFERRLAGLEVTGMSDGGWVSLRSRGLVSWQVTFRGEPVRSLSEQEFLAELDGAVAAVLADHRHQVVLLTDEIYDIGLPRSMRGEA